MSQPDADGIPPKLTDKQMIDASLAAQSAILGVTGPNVRSSDVVDICLSMAIITARKSGWTPDALADRVREWMGRQ